MSSAPLKNIMLVGAAGRIGAPILTALMAESSFNITILTRSSSAATFPSHLSTKRISDSFPLSELTDAFTGQDAVIVATNATAVTKPTTSASDLKDDLPYRFIDAAIAAGVRRFIPSDFGLDNLNRRGREVSPVYEAKGKMTEYLMEKCQESGMEWTCICCGTWVDWALNPPTSGAFYSISIPARTGILYDTASTPFSCTTITNIGLAVARLLSPKHIAHTANKQIFLSDFVATPRTILTEIEKQLDTQFEVERKESGPLLKKLREEVEGNWEKAYELLALTFVADVGKEMGYDFEATGKETWNARLRLPVVTLEKIVREALKAAKML